jgi:pilus assembly protein CpaC
MLRVCGRASRKSVGRALKALLTVLVLLLFATVSLHAQDRARRQAAAEDSTLVRHVVVTVNKSRTITFPSPFKTASIASTEIADITPLTDRSIYIQGKKIGTTNVSIFDQNMQLVELLDLEVTIDTGSLQDKIRARTGHNWIRVTSNSGEVVLSGTAPDAVSADQAVALAKSVVKTSEIVNAIAVAPAQQVMLKVRFLEASRSAERDLGVNWFATNSSGSRGFSIGRGTPNIGPVPTTTTTTSGSTTTTTATANNTGGISLIKSSGALLSTASGEPFGVVLANLINGGTNIDVMVSALETKGLVRRLAEPNLVALSGDEARFLAGGEFPVPIAVSTTTGAGITPTIEFKKFGVSLGFVPTVLGRGLINLRIAPEVSELDFSNAVTISGTVIPSLVVRNAQTTIELRDGQSFAIAGLLQSRGARNIDQVPWLGTVPVLGALFRSSAYQNQESDLVIIVTPHLVQPTTPVDRLATPFDQRLPSNDSDFFINGQLEVPKRYTDYVTSGGELNGPYGAIVGIQQGPNQPVYKNGVRK